MLQKFSKMLLRYSDIRSVVLKQRSAKAMGGGIDTNTGQALVVIKLQILTQKTKT